MSARWSVLAAPLLAAACATPPTAPPSSECAQWFRALDDQVDAAQVRDVQEARVPGHPYVRVNRLLASYRGAALRVCPVFAVHDQQERAARFNLEFRVCDAAASPYMALGALIFAGADGVARKLALPKEAPALPRSLGGALDLMEGNEAVKSWFGPVFFEAYLRHKRSEVAYVADLSPEDLCARYAEVY